MRIFRRRKPQLFTTPPQPIILNGPGVIRWAAGWPDGPRSHTWMVWATKNDDVYGGTRGLSKDMKLSLHASTWRMAFTDQAAKEHVPAGQDRVLTRWAPTEELAHGWRLAAVINTPAETFSGPWREKRTSDGGRVLWFPAPPPEALQFLVVLGDPVRDPLTINDVIGDVGRITLPSGRVVWVLPGHGCWTNRVANR